MSTQDVYNYRRVNDRVATGGQPTAAQLNAAAVEGFQAVINLATFDPDHSLPDEAGLVHGLGLEYYPIPVVWGHPTAEDFASFERVMLGLGERKTFIHCAANFRVTAFYSLYALKHLGWSEADADAFRASIWQGRHDPVWERFIGDMKARILAEGPVAPTPSP